MLIFEINLLSASAGSIPARSTTGAVVVVNLSIENL
jgi:hypothetical protein